MKLPIIVGVMLGVLFGIPDASAAKFEQKRFVHPTYQGYRLDWCLEGSCGGSAAQAYCRWKGYDAALEFGMDRTLRASTKAMQSQGPCRDCEGFDWIVCERFSDKLRSVVPCLAITNTGGEGAPTCRGEQGHRDGTSAMSFCKGEKVWILLRLRNLRPGKHLLTTAVSGIYERVRTGSVEWAQNISFSNSEKNWWLWFPSKTADSGEWTEEIFIDGERLGYVEYRVSDALRDRPTTLFVLHELFGL